MTRVAGRPSTTMIRGTDLPRVSRWRLDRRWAVVVVAAALGWGAAGCAGGRSPQATPGSAATPGVTVAAAGRPAGVPDTATQVREGLSVGDPAGGPAPLRFFAMTCDAGVMTVATDGLILYAELPCDRALPAEAVQTFLGKPVRIRVVFGQTGAKLYLESSEAGTAEFTVGSIWRS